jgi:hypothetical protein
MVGKIDVTWRFGWAKEDLSAKKLVRRIACYLSLVWASCASNLTNGITLPEPTANGADFSGRVNLSELLNCASYCTETIFVGSCRLTGEALELLWRRGEKTVNQASMDLTIVIFVLGSQLSDSGPIDRLVSAYFVWFSPF